MGETIPRHDTVSLSGSTLLLTGENEFICLKYSQDVPLILGKNWSYVS